VWSGGFPPGGIAPPTWRGRLLIGQPLGFDAAFCGLPISSNLHNNGKHNDIPDQLTTIAESAGRASCFCTMENLTHMSSRSQGGALLQTGPFAPWIHQRMPL
jgi:hypothetical protein